MANLFIPLDPNGAPSDVSALGKTKTIIVDGVFSGVAQIEISNGGGFVPLESFSAPGKKTIEVAAKEMRVTGAAGAPAISVSADDVGAKFVSLPLGGVAGVDVSALGTFNTIVVDGVVNGLITIQTSEDDVNWVDCVSFQNAGMESLEFVAQYMRAQYSGSSAPVVSVGATNAQSDSSTPVIDYVFRPGAVGDDAPGGNVYTDFIKLMAAFTSTKNNGTRRISFDNRFSTDIDPALGGPVCFIPANPEGGSWDLAGGRIASSGQNPGTGSTGSISITTIQFQEGASFINCLFIDGSLGIDTVSSTPCFFLDEFEDTVVTGQRVQFPRSTLAAAPHFALSGDTGTLFIMGGQGTGWGSFTYGLPARPIIDVPAGKTMRVFVETGFFGPETCQGAGTMLLFLDSALSSVYLGSIQPQSLWTGTWITFSQMVSRIQLDSPVRNADFSANYSNFERIDTSGGAIKATLPAAGPFRVGEQVMLKDITGDAALNNITIEALPGELIDGAASVVIAANYGSAVVWSDGTNWWVL